MKAILEFNLPEDKEEFDVASKGMDWALLVWHIDQFIQNKIKYEQDTHGVLQLLRNELNFQLEEKGLQYPSQKYIMYKPLPDYVTIRESSIAGLGLFATKKIPAGTYIGIVHIINENNPADIIRTPLGGFGNHSDTPNCFKVKLENDNSWIGTIRDIEPDEEITWKYTLYEIK